jgi:hypothetical protein
LAAAGLAVTVCGENVSNKKGHIMDAETFMSEVTSYVDLYCHEYMEDVAIVFDTNDTDDLFAEVIMRDFRGNNWNLPLKVSDDGDIGIDIGEAGFLETHDAAGLYVYLWHNAIA